MHPLLKDKVGKKMLMLGGFARTGTIPVSAELLRETISKKTKSAFVKINLKAFDLGMQAVGSGI